MFKKKHANECRLKDQINLEIFIKIKLFTRTKTVVRAVIITNEMRS